MREEGQSLLLARWYIGFTQTLSLLPLDHLTGLGQNNSCLLIGPSLSLPPEPASTVAVSGPTFIKLWPMNHQGI